jgi:hypothetical protein
MRAQRLRRGFAWIAATVAAGAVVALFFHPTLAHSPLSGFDWFMSRSYYDWARTAFTEYGAFPLYMAGAAHSFNLIANPQSPVLSPLIWLLVFLPTVTYLKLLLVAYATLGLIGMVALLREQGVSLEIAAFAGVVFTFNGFFVAHFAVGHPFVLGAYLFPVLLLLFERARRGSGAALWGAAGVNVLVLLEGANHPFLWQNVLLLLLAMAWCLESRSLRPAWTWLRFLGLSLGLGAFKLLPMLAEFHTYAPAQRNPGFPPAAALWSLTQHGQNAATSYPGIAFQLGTGWWEYAFYAGAVPCVFLVAGLAAARRRWPLLVAGAFFLIISLDGRAGSLRLDPWGLIDDLPGWRTQRVPSRFLLVAIFAFLVAAAMGMQRMLDSLRERRLLRTALRGALALTAILVFVDLRSQSEPWQEESSESQQMRLEHRPPIMLIPAAPGATARFSEFSPNRFTVAVRSPVAAHLVLAGERWIRRHNWRIEGGAMASIGERVAARIGPGEHEVRFRYLPRFFRLGVALSALTLLTGMLRGSGLLPRRAGRAPAGT